MKRRILALAILGLLLPGAAAADEMDGKSLEELLKIVSEKIARRKEDARLLSDYKAFKKREEPKLMRYGESLGRMAGKYRSHESWAYVLHLYGLYRQSLEVLTRLKMTYQKSSRHLIRLQGVYIAMAWNYIYLGRPTEANGAMTSIMRGGFRGQIDAHMAKMKKFPAMRKTMEEAFLKRNLAPGDPNDQWELCRTLGEKTLFPFKERVELLWMRKAYPKDPNVVGSHLDWLLVVNAEKLMDFSAAAKGADAFRRNRKLKEFWAVKSGEVLWVLANAYMNLGKWKESSGYLHKLKERHPKHQQVESGRCEQRIRYVVGRDKSKAKIDVLPIEWGKGL